MKTIDVQSPLDGSNLGRIEVADASAVDAAVARSQAAFASWGDVPVKERVQPLFRFKQLVEQEMPSLATLVSSENGKTVDEAAAGIAQGLEVVE